MYTTSDSFQFRYKELYYIESCNLFIWMDLILQGHSYYSRFSLEKRGMDDSQRRASLSNNEKFVPKFDGLRFIETLVTAHR